MDKMLNFLTKYFKRESFLSNVKIKRTKRIRTISLQIKEGRAVILCPFFTSDRQIQTIINKKRTWIQKKIDEQKNQKESLDTLLKSGKIILFGQEKKFTFKKSYSNKVCMINDNLVISSSNQSLKNIKKLIINWSRNKSEKYLKERTKSISTRIKIFFNNVYIKNYKARWGACSASGDIYLNWKLVLLPPKIIDYVIVHELCHIEEHNHSKKFWEILSKFVPDYKAKKMWLKENSNPIILFS